MLALADGGSSDEAICAGCQQAMTTALVVGPNPFAKSAQPLLQQFASQQLPVVRLMLDWLKVSLAATPPRPERGRGVAAAAAEAARQIRGVMERRPKEIPLNVWSEFLPVATGWADTNSAIEAFAIVRSGSSRSVDLLHRDALRTSARETTRQIAATRAALLASDEPGLAAAMQALERAFEELGGVEHHGVLTRFEAAVTAWGEFVPTHESDWRTDVVEPQRDLAEALSAWLDGVGAGGNVASNLTSERAPVRLAAWSAAARATQAGTARAGDVRSPNWAAQAAAARALALAAADTDLVTHAGTSNAGPISADERPLDERQLKLTASAAASSWFAASTHWAALGEDDIAHACRSSAVALGAVAVLDGITAATLGWAAREAWRAV